MVVVAFAGVEREAVAHGGQRLACAGVKLRVKPLGADETLFGIGALAPANDLGAGEFVIQEIALIFVGVGDNGRVADEILKFLLDLRKSRRVLQVARLDLVDGDGRRVDRAVGIDQLPPAPGFAPRLSLPLHLDKAHLDDDSRRLPGEGLLFDEIGAGRPFAGRLGVKGDESVEPIEKIRREHFWLLREGTGILRGLSGAVAESLREKRRFQARCHCIYMSGLHIMTPR